MKRRLRLGPALIGFSGLALVLLLAGVFFPIPEVVPLRGLSYGFLCLLLLSLLGISLFVVVSRKETKNMNVRLSDLKESLIKELAILVKKYDALDIALKNPGASVDKGPELITSKNSPASGPSPSSPNETERCSDAETARRFQDSHDNQAPAIGEYEQGSRNAAHNKTNGDTEALKFKDWCNVNLPLMDSVLRKVYEGPEGFDGIEPRLRGAGVMFSRARRFEYSNLLALEIDRGEIRGHVVLFPALYFHSKVPYRTFSV